MMFNDRMLILWNEYKATVAEYKAGIVPAHIFLETHARWNKAVEAFEHECSASSNYGAF